MARRKTGVAEDFVSVVAKLPWWAGLAIGFIAWLLFHRLAATAPAPASLQPGQMGIFVQRSMLAALSNALQYAIPLLCGVAAGISWLQRRKRAALAATVTSSPAADALSRMDWREFEALVAEAFRRQGYGVAQAGGPAPDGGVDVVLRKGSESFLVQCKHWRAYKVGVDVVRQLYGVMAARGAAGGFVVTSGSFTAEAATFAQGRNIELVDGPRLTRLLGAVRASGAGTPAATAAPSQPPPPKAVAGLEPAPQCPSCEAPMVRRTARKGAGAGSQFWGCSRFPACRGTR